MIRVFRIRRKCGAKIFSDAPRGLCTACVLETALGIFPDAAVAGGVTRTHGRIRKRSGVATVADSKEACTRRTHAGRVRRL